MREWRRSSLGFLFFAFACGAEGLSGDSPPTQDAGIDRRVDASLSAKEVTVGGTVSRLAGTGLVLRNNGGDDLAVAASGPFQFKGPIKSGSSFDVTVATSPTNPVQTCSVQGGKGVANNSDISSVAVTCSTKAYFVKGELSGLSGVGPVTLQVNGQDSLPLATNGSFTFTTPLASGSTYEVTVLQNPSTPAQICTVTHGNGTLTDADVTDVSVSCALSTFTIGGAVNGLGSSGLVMQNNGSDGIPLVADGTFTFATKIAAGSPYDVKVATQPQNHYCTVPNGAGTVVDTNISVNITCIKDYMNEVMASTPVAYFKLNDATGQLVDVVSARGGTPTGGITYSNVGLVHKGTSLLFNGTDGKVDVPFDAAMNPVASDFSVEVWFRIDGGSGNYRSPVASRDDNGNQRGYILYVSPTNNIHFWTGNGTGWNAATGPVMSDGLTYHAVGTYTNATKTTRIYLNGSEVGSANIGTFAPNTQRPLRIGASATELVAGNYFFNGLIDDVAIYARALPATEIMKHYTVGTTR